MLRSLFALSLIALLSVALSGCGPSRPTELKPDVKVRASATRVVTGETVIMQAETQNLLGKDAKVQWDAPGGHVEAKDAGKTAMVSYPRPGTYSVMATLIVDGREEKTISTIIDVKPIP